MKKNILFIIESLSNGGSERTITNLSNELINDNNIYIVVCNNKIDYKLNSKIKIIEIPNLQLRNPIKRIIGIIKLRKIKKIYNINTSISFITSFNLFNTLSKYKEKTIVSIRNHQSTKNESIIAKVSNKLSNKLCDLIVCCSKSVYEDQINNFNAKKEKTIIIENFTTIKKLNNSKKDNIICTIGRLTEHKGQIHIINAMKEVIKEYPEYKLLIIGRGEKYNELNDYIKDNKLNKNIKLLGFKNNIDYYLNKSKIFVLTSYYEGFSNSILEAMTLGIPVIATDSPGGNKEILDNKYGILIPDFNNRETNIKENELLLSKEIIKLIKDKKIYNYYHNKSLERVKKYDKKIIINKWLNII